MAGKNAFRNARRGAPAEQAAGCQADYAGTLPGKQDKYPCGRIPLREV